MVPFGSVFPSTNTTTTCVAVSPDCGVDRQTTHARRQALAGGHSAADNMSLQISACFMFHFPAIYYIT